MINVVMIGGLTNGKIVYDYLIKNKFVNLQLVITYPDDPSQARYAKLPKSDIIIRDTSANKWSSTIATLKPDLIITVGWSELLDDSLLTIPPMGAIGFHPAKLPYDRGRSVLAWQIEEGYTQTALTLFYYNDLPDGGDIIAQENISIHPTDYINDVLDKVDKATYNIMYAYFPLIRTGRAPRQPQDLNIGSFRRLRKQRDSIISLSAPTSEIINKIRAISHPYPGAELILDGVTYKVWRAEAVDDANKAISADDSLIVKCRDGHIKITEYDIIR